MTAQEIKEERIEKFYTISITNKYKKCQICRVRRVTGLFERKRFKYLLTLFKIARILYF